MTACVFVFVYCLGKPLFVYFAVSGRNRFLTAFTVGVIFETTVFALISTSNYKFIGL